MSRRPDLLYDMVELRRRGAAASALTAVVETFGFIMVKPRAKALLASDGPVLAGWVGGGCAEAAIRQATLVCLCDGLLRVTPPDQDDEFLGTSILCDANMRVHVEPRTPLPTFCGLGPGAVAECLRRSGLSPGLRVAVDAVNSTRYTDAAEIVVDGYRHERLEPRTPNIVIVVNQNREDHLSAVAVLRSPTRRIPIIAGTEWARLEREFLPEHGFFEGELTKFHAPTGLDPGAETLDEIASLVLGEIVMDRRGRTARPMEQEAGERSRSVLHEDGASNRHAMESA